MATAVASSVLESIASSVSSNISSQMKEQLIQENMQVSPLSSSLLNEPIQYSSINVLGFSTNLNKGLTPFMIVLITSITGLMGAQMIHGYLNKISDRLREKGHSLAY